MTGTVLGTRYEILEKVGMGGMAIVYKAKDKLLNRFVAVKVLRSEYEGNEEFIRRFNIESQAAASLSHPNIVPIYDVGESGGRQYIVMEYLEGETLKQYIAEHKGGVDWRAATEISVQICSALEHAHQKHIIHRDIKPQNIILTTEGIVKVTDFGIARAVNNVTTKMEAVGSAHYLSPEQARGGYTDQRSDIYSLGVVMYELFTGRLPFDGETPVAVAMQHMQAEPIRPRLINPDIPQTIEDIILKAMSKEQRLRYESATAMLADLKRVYANPNAEVAHIEEDNSDKFGTRVMPPIVNITMPDAQKNEHTEKPLVRRTADSETPVRKTAPKKQKNTKGDTIAVIAAIFTMAAVAVILGFIVYNILGGSLFGAKETETGEYKTPNLVGMTLEQAQDTVEDTGFTLTVESQEYSDSVKENCIIRQDPGYDEAFDEPCEIKIVISLGIETFEIEDYTGREGSEAETELLEKGMKVTIVRESNDEMPSGLVIRQLPTAGTQVTTGKSVTLTVSMGPDEEPVEVPNVIGLSQSAARSLIERSGLVVTEMAVESEETKGTVVKQSPEALSEAEEGDEVIIYISEGKKTTTTQETPETQQEEKNETPESNNSNAGDTPGSGSGDSGSTPQTSDSGL